MSGKIARLYRRVPNLDCKGLCQNSCTGPIPASAPERELVARAGVPLPVFKSPCGNLVDGRCTVYEIRPLICRLWGTVDNMPCPHGCVPDGGRLTVQQGGELVADAVEIAGEAV